MIFKALSEKGMTVCLSDGGQVFNGFFSRWLAYNYAPDNYKLITYADIVTDLSYFYT